MMTGSAERSLGDSGLPRRTVLGLMIGASTSYCMAAVPVYQWEEVPVTRRIALKFQDAAGHARSSDYFSQSPLLINFWASWCLPCLIELPALDRLASDPVRGRLKIVALSLDASGIGPVLDVFRRAKIRNLEPLVDTAGESLGRASVPSLPFNMLVAGDGRIMATRRGRVDWNSRSERQALGALLTRVGLN